MSFFEKRYEPGLLAIEVLTLLYIALTSIMLLIFPHFVPINGLGEMWGFRAGVVGFIVLANLLYRRWPCEAVCWLRMLPLFAALAQWYPETYEFCKAFPYHDALFAEMDQWLFGCQPAIEFVRTFNSDWAYELMYAGYYSYYYLMILVLLVILIRRHGYAAEAVWIFMGAFFCYYLVYAFLPVAGPQYYFQAIGMPAAEAGRFSDVGDYFLHHTEMLPYDIRGLFSGLVHAAHEAGERPTAAFPSSHCGMCVVSMMLAWKSRERALFWLLMPVAVVLILSTVYTRAHYVVDSIAGVLTGVLLFLLMEWIYPHARRFFRIR